MSCGAHHGQCGLTYEQALAYFETYISNALLCGKLQGGISACDSETILPAGSAVVTCEQLQKKVNDLLANGELDIPGIESLKFDGERLTLVDQTGQSWQVDLKGLAGRTVENLQMLKDGSLTLTLKDGTTFKIPLQEYLADLVKDAGIKSGTLDQDGNLVLSLGNGDQITVNMDALKKVYVERDGPLTGDGTKDNPLDVDFARVCWQVIESMHFTEEGLVIQIANQCDPVVLPLDAILTVLNSRVKVCVDSKQGVITGNGSTGECLSLDLDKLVSLMVKNDTLINNIANALHYKIKVAVTQGITGDGTKDNPLNVKLSPDGGNLLTLRDNGVYYGTQAAADITHLYVDSATGDDSNKGTINAPLKTIAKAISMVREDQSNTIHLRAGGRFVWPSMSVTGGASRVFTVYADPYCDGDKVPTATPDKPSYSWAIHKGVNRPVLYLETVYTSSNHVYAVRGANVNNGGKISFEGIQFEAKAYNEPGSGLEPDDFDGATWQRWEMTSFVTGSGSGVCQFTGCVFDMYYLPCAAQGSPCNAKHDWLNIVDALVWGTGVPSVTFTSCSHLKKANGVSDDSLGSAVFNLHPATGTVAVVNNDDSWGSEAGYEFLDFNLQKIPADRLVSGITRDTAGNPRNLAANLVL